MCRTSIRCNILAGWSKLQTSTQPKASHVLIILTKAQQKSLICLLYDETYPPFNESVKSTEPNLQIDKPYVPDGGTTTEASTTTKNETSTETTIGDKTALTTTTDLIVHFQV